ncbi:MAG TPA: divalent metal cation transporter, partial [Ktedonobacteraceae bacterium]|nr:divalent metal cation transporter [Ktedonobacteraceae bacterium]
LFIHHISAANFATADFAQALAPLIGHVGASLFALGIVEAGLLATITITASSAYAFGEVTATPHSLNRPLREAWPFYVTMLLAAGMATALVLWPQAPLELIVLIVNVIATLSMPPALLFLFLLVNDREIMGAHINSRLTNIVVIAIVVFLCLAGLTFGVVSVFPSILPS